MPERSLKRLHAHNNTTCHHIAGLQASRGPERAPLFPLSVSSSGAGRYRTRLIGDSLRMDGALMSDISGATWSPADDAPPG